MINEFFIGEDNYKLIQIPPGLANGYKAYGDKQCILANCSTHPHEKNEIIYIDPKNNSIPYNWDLRNK
jgi:dTDP-4-dehydrorhamnose 3,5-epimerase